MTSERCGPRGTWQAVFPSAEVVPSLRDLFPFFDATRDFRPGLSDVAPSGLGFEDDAAPSGLDFADPGIAAPGAKVPCFASAGVGGRLGFAVAGRTSASVPTWGVHGSGSAAASGCWPW